jgi:hypothetical protein
MTREQASQITTGLLLSVAGLLFFSESFDISLGYGPDFGRIELGRLRPLFLITIGIGRFLVPREEGRWGSGAWLLFLGGLFLMHTHRFVALRQSWPLFIVAGGVSLMIGNARGRRSLRRRRDVR